MYDMCEGIYGYVNLACMMYVLKSSKERIQGETGKMKA